MKITTRAIFQMTDDGLIELERESYEYDGPVAEAKGGGGTPAQAPMPLPIYPGNNPGAQQQMIQNQGIQSQESQMLQEGGSGGSGKGGGGIWSQAAPAVINSLQSNGTLKGGGMSTMPVQQPGGYTTSTFLQPNPPVAQINSGFGGNTNNPNNPPPTFLQPVQPGGQMIQNAGIQSQESQMLQEAANPPGYAGMSGYGNMRPPWMQ